MTSVYNTIYLETEKNRVKRVNDTFNRLRFYTTLYHTQQLLYYKGHIQMTSNHNTIDSEKKTLE